MNNKNIIIQGVHMEVTEALKNIVHTKAEKLFRHSDEIVRIRIEMTHDGQHGEEEFIAKGHIEIRGKDIHITETTDDLYKSIDGLIDKLDRKLRQRARSEKSKRDHPHGVDISTSIPKAR